MDRGWKTYSLSGPRGCLRGRSWYSSSSLSPTIRRLARNSKLRDDGTLHRRCKAASECETVA